MTTKSHRLLENMIKARGYAYPSFKLLAEEDPAFLQAYDQLYALIMLRRRRFPEKIKELFFLCSVAGRNPSDTNAMKNHMRRALEKGAKKSEIIEALECAFMPAGALSFLYGINVMIDLLKEEKGKKHNSND